MFFWSLQPGDEKFSPHRRRFYSQGPINALMRRFRSSGHPDVMRFPAFLVLNYYSGALVRAQVGSHTSPLPIDPFQAQRAFYVAE